MTGQVTQLYCWICCWQLFLLTWHGDIYPARPFQFSVQEEEFQTWCVGTQHLRKGLPSQVTGQLWILCLEKCARYEHDKQFMYLPWWQLKCWRVPWWQMLWWQVPWWHCCDHWCHYGCHDDRYHDNWYRSVPLTEYWTSRYSDSAGISSISKA